MDNVLIENFNSVVKECDLVYFVGDFSLVGTQHNRYYKSLMKRYNKCRKIFILGNHDHLKPFSYVKLGFESVHTSLEITLNGKNYILVHDPAASCMDRNKIFLCGHIHDLFKVQKNVINVGIDVWDYFPASLEQIEKEVKRIKGENNGKRA